MKMMNKTFFKAAFNGGKGWGKQRAGKMFLTYRQWVAQLALLFALVSLLLGWWKLALGGWIFWHFHMLIAENYWKIRTIEYHLDQKNDKNKED